MTTKEVADMIAGIGVPTAYYQFIDNTGIAPPFICFYYPGDNNFKADGINYAKINRLIIELYTNNKDFALEAEVENVLTENGFAFSRNETYIGTEQMYMVIFETQVVITEEAENDTEELIDGE